MEQEKTDTQKFLVDFGKLLKKARKGMGLSQVNAAADMKIDYRHYQNIEGGKINLRLDTMMKLIKFYLGQGQRRDRSGNLLRSDERRSVEEIRTDWRSSTITSYAVEKLDTAFVELHDDQPYE